jgi:dipeptidyl aminopeptidase/acylaminoacyl peptidase
MRRPFIWNPVTDVRTDLDLPALGGDVVPVDWSPDARQLLLCQTDQAVQQLYRYDIDKTLLEKLEHPAGFFEISKHYGPYYRSETEIWIGWEDATHPPQLIALDAQTGQKMRDVLVASEALPGHSLQSITFPSSDGQMIQGWLGVPPGKGPFPTIVYLHGGPEHAIMNWFDPESQTWLDHGFAFLTINYRGSTTFGRDFQSMIWGNFGHWELEDIAAAHDWLVQSGVARPDQVFLTGWSYGGYLTLLALGKQPDRWAGGMAGAAIADWTLAYQDSADTLRRYDELALGGTPEEKPEQYARSSPLTYVEQVQSPVLVIQGRHDTRTPPRQMEIYEAKMRELGREIEVVWFEAGHIGGEIAQAIYHQALRLQFACRLSGKEAPD